MGFLGPGIEWAIKPFAERDRVLQRYVARRPPENQDAEANIRWGAKSTFGFKKGDYAIGPTVTVNYPDPEPEEPEDVPEEITVDFSEVCRTVQERRVENPDDPEQYVDVEDTTVIVVSGPDLRPDSMIGREGRQAKIYYRFTFADQGE